MKNGDAATSGILPFDANGPSDIFVLRLYVSEATPASARAVVNARRLCEEHLKGRYRLQILDIVDNVALAIEDQIVAAPTLIKISPPPLRRFIGDMSNVGRILSGLNVVPASGTEP
ncbi:MAG: circadian clock KaiB family protein [Caldimonas sp.]